VTSAGPEVTVTFAPGSVSANGELLPGGVGVTPYIINEGSSLALNRGVAMGTPDAGSHVWRINGQVVATGESPVVSWATLGSIGIVNDGVHSVTLTVTYGNGALTAVSDPAPLIVRNVAATGDLKNFEHWDQGSSAVVNFINVADVVDTAFSYQLYVPLLPDYVRQAPRPLDALAPGYAERLAAIADLEADRLALATSGLRDADARMAAITELKDDVLRGIDPGLVRGLGDALLAGIDVATIDQAAILGLRFSDGDATVGSPTEQAISGLVALVHGTGTAASPLGRDAISALLTNLGRLDPASADYAANVQLIVSLGTQVDGLDVFARDLGLQLSALVEQSNVLVFSEASVSNTLPTSVTARAGTYTVVGRIFDGTDYTEVRTKVTVVNTAPQVSIDFDQAVLIADEGSVATITGTYLNPGGLPLRAMIAQLPGMAPGETFGTVTFTAPNSRGIGTWTWTHTLDDGPLRLRVADHHHRLRRGHHPDRSRRRHRHRYFRTRGGEHRTEGDARPGDDPGGRSARSRPERRGRSLGSRQCRRLQLLLQLRGWSRLRAGFGGADGARGRSQRKWRDRDQDPRRRQGWRSRTGHPDGLHRERRSRRDRSGRQRSDQRDGNRLGHRQGGRSGDARQPHHRSGVGRRLDRHLLLHGELAGPAPGGQCRQRFREHRKHLRNGWLGMGMHLALIAAEDGSLAGVEVTVPGTGYRPGDVVTVGNASLVLVAVRSGDTTEFQFTHRYDDDAREPGGQGSDRIPITVKVSDDDGGTGSDTVEVTVNNVDPVLNPATLTNADGSALGTSGGGVVTLVGGGTVALSGSFDDISPLDTHKVTVDWGDGNSTVLTFGGRTTIDFERDGQLNPLLAGDLAGSIYLDQANGRGFTISTGDPNRPAMIFDTARPTGGDFDIATPNIHYGGLGQHATVAAPGTTVEGRYGSIRLETDGTYSYVVNSLSHEVRTLLPGQTLTEEFGYTLSSGLRGTLAITIGGGVGAPGQATFANTEANPFTGDLLLVGTEISNVIIFGEDLRIEGGSTTREEGMNAIDLGKVLIISKDGDSLDPDDDEAGGSLTFDFNSRVIVHSIDLLDINEEGGKIELFDADGNLLSTTIIPAIGENTFQTVFVKAATDGTPFEATRMVVTLAGDGAIANFVYTDVDPIREYRIEHRYVEESAPGTPHQITITVEDDDGGVDTMVHGEIEVTNGPPIIESLVAIPASGDRGTVTTIARFVDSTGDLHTATVDFGDGTVVEAIVLTYDPVTGRFEAPVYPGTTEIVTFIDPVTGDRVPLVDPVSGEFNLGGLVDPATGRMAPLHDPATGGTTTSYAVLDASTRQVFATHRYSASSDYEITITVSDEEEAAADEVVDYRSFEASLGTPRPPIDIIPALERQGFDLSRLTGGSGIFGERIAAGVFGGVGFDREGFVDLAIFAGRAAPGGIITVSFYNELGDLVGFEEVSVDSRGYWMLQVDGILLDPGKNGIRGIEVSKGFLPDGRIDAQRYDFRIDSAIEDALREHFQIGESPFAGRILSPVDRELE
jgi:VCBS repeat-containing protein